MAYLFIVSLVSRRLVLVLRTFFGYLVGVGGSSGILVEVGDYFLAVCLVSILWFESDHFWLVDDHFSGQKSSSSS